MPNRRSGAANVSAHLIRGGFAFWSGVCNGTVTQSQQQERPGMLQQETAWIGPCLAGGLCRACVVLSLLGNDGARTSAWGAWHPNPANVISSNCAAFFTSPRSDIASIARQTDTAFLVAKLLTLVSVPSVLGFLLVFCFPRSRRCSSLRIWEE